LSSTIIASFHAIVLELIAVILAQINHPLIEAGFSLSFKSETIGANNHNLSDVVFRVIIAHEIVSQVETKLVHVIVSKSLSQLHVNHELVIVVVRAIHDFEVSS